jgi:hypothetical protein
MNQEKFMSKKLISIVVLACVIIMTLVACTAKTSSTTNGAPSGNPPSGTMPSGTRPSGTMPAANSTDTTVATTAAPTATTEPTATNTPAPTATATAVTYSASPILAITCLRGPADTYTVLYYVSQGESLTAIGRDATNSYYLVQSTTDSTKVCWLWKDYVTVNGNAYTLPVATALPTK